MNSPSSTSIVTSGHSGEAISFNGASYLQISSFTALGWSTKSFSIMFWTRPRSINRTIVHVSSLASGQGWCLGLIGISANGSVGGQIYNTGSFSIPIFGPLISTSPTWSHIVETWSLTNGLRLYVNGALVSSVPSATVYTASNVQDFITLGNSLSGINHCYGGAIGVRAPGPFDGDVDDFRVYSRELTAANIYTIYQS